MNDKYFNDWVMQTATTWDDISDSIECVGISFIDRDHKQLANYLVEINRIIIDLKSNKINMNLINKQKDVLTKLYDFAVVHFGREEKMIPKFKLNCLSIQKEQHTKILNMLKLILDSFSKGSTTITEDLKLKMLDWLVVHINKYDYNTYNLKNWNRQILEAKSITDVLILMKLSGIISIDKSNKKLIEHVFKTFNNYSEDSDFNKLKKGIQSISNELKTNLESEIQFMNRYKLQGQELQKSEHLKNCEFLENLKLIEEEDLSKFKVEILIRLLKHISLTDYKLLNAEDHVNNLLLNASTKVEIEWLIYKTKYAEIDKQHSNFIDLVLHFTHLLDKTTSEKEQLEIITEATTALCKYAKDHFEYEEKIMEENPNLPGVDEHKLKHKEILDLLAQIKYYIDNQKVNLFTILRSKILNLWIHHTNTMDQITFKS